MRTLRTLRAFAFSALLLATTSTAAFAGDGSGYALPHSPSDLTARGDGSGYALPSENQPVRGDGSGYMTPTVPGSQQDYERWV